MRYMTDRLFEEFCFLGLGLGLGLSASPKARITVAKENPKIMVLECLSQSPELNPNENLWRGLKVKAGKPHISHEVD